MYSFSASSFGLVGLFRVSLGFWVGFLLFLIFGGFWRVFLLGFFFGGWAMFFSLNKDFVEVLTKLLSATD